jgi:tRNA(fMet)-specific endonuclease VapC
MKGIRYLLDTDTCIFACRHKPESVLARLSMVGFDAVGLSAVTFYELAYGAEKHPHPIKAREQLRRFLHPFQILPWNDQAALECARIRARLEIRGKMIGPYDVQIAAHARCLGLTVVTNNESEFRRVDRLRVENWCAPPAP